MKPSASQPNLLEERDAPLRAADIVAPVAVDTAYSYRIPAGMTLQPGDIVDIPLGNRETTGVVWAVRETPSASNLKTVTARRDLPALKADLLRFVDWVARWTLSPRGMVLRMAIRAAEDVGPDPVRLGYRATGVAPERITPARARVLAAAADGFAHVKSALAEAAACSGGVVDSLVDCGALEAVRYDSGRHLIILTTITGVCKHCRKRSRYRCDRCQVALHAECFFRFHVQEGEEIVKEEVPVILLRFCFKNSVRINSLSYLWVLDFVLLFFQV